MPDVAVRVEPVFFRMAREKTGFLAWLDATG